MPSINCKFKYYMLLYATHILKCSQTNITSGRVTTTTVYFHLIKNIYTFIKNTIENVFNKKY